MRRRFYSRNLRESLLVHVRQIVQLIFVGDPGLQAWVQHALHARQAFFLRWRCSMLVDERDFCLHTTASWAHFHICGVQLEGSRTRCIIPPITSWPRRANWFNKTTLEIESFMNFACSEAANWKGLNPFCLKRAKIEGVVPNRVSVSNLSGSPIPKILVEYPPPREGRPWSISKRSPHARRSLW